LWTVRFSLLAPRYGCARPDLDARRPGDRHAGLAIHGGAPPRAVSLRNIVPSPFAIDSDLVPVGVPFAIGESHYETQVLKLFAAPSKLNSLELDVLAIRAAGGRLGDEADVGESRVPHNRSDTIVADNATDMVSLVFTPRGKMQQGPHGCKDLPTNSNVRVLLLATRCGAVRDVHAHHILCAEDVDHPLLEPADAGNSGQIAAHCVNVANVEAELDAATIPAERSYGAKLLD
jgi:hypothetical protein